ncbi:uncharacterized protein BO80DRAFT_408934 [Aspergillus ibericus CBS 121593]|uniref:N-acetyltransferase domain-containing protein n=1 Tax=Aspergillus ibericus CBS 121593 TaxID=1448316 RepID=A0A395GYK6_9EURO|nr:hypothetical protein BO80DRAFT_408934 [Aspergillus ibericus CBS 121593]RAL00159.1 hypothetical protein BO80DRAFT_408934 [Aspergillus ibericus CBS 121593]
MILSRLTDPHWSFLFIDPIPANIISATRNRLPHTLTTARDARRHEVIILDTTPTPTSSSSSSSSDPENKDAKDQKNEKVIAYARWTLPPSLAQQQPEGTVWVSGQVPSPSESEKQKYKEAYDAASDAKGRVPGMKDTGLLEFRSAPLERAEEKILSVDGVVKGEEVLTLEYLTTHPKYWHLGAASMLVKSGTDVADKYGLKTYVMSEPAGLKVYLNHGFKVVEEVAVDYARFGGTEETVHYFLVREAVPL